MNWWAIGITLGISVVGFLAGWTIGSFLALTADLDRDPWDVWEDEEW